jgi:MOSC domain-containing protein YiiM
MGKLERIWIKRAHGGRMDLVETATLVNNKGLRGNADYGVRRQVTIVSLERWAEVTHDVGADVDPSARRANLLVSGVDLLDSRGRVLRVGSCRLEIGGEVRPCELMEAAHAGLQRAMSPRWGGGAWARVLDEGEIRIGDAVEWAI